jgi:uncharacterized membrane protein YjjB (DUF3815 family)
MIDLLLILQDAFWSALAAVGFAVILNVPRQALWGSAFGGALGHATRTALMQLGLDIVVATLIAATLIGVIGVVLARRWQIPSPVITVSASITLVPGVFAYEAMIAILEIARGDSPDMQAALVTAASNGIRTALILGAIGLGIAAPTMVFEREAPVV